MLAFFLSDINLPYTIAISIVFLFTLIEILGLFIGLSVLGMFDKISPFELDGNADVSVEAGGLTATLDWLCISKLPLLIWLIIVFTLFSISGFILNFIALSTFQWSPSLLMTLPITIVMTVVLIHLLGSTLAKIFPQRDSSVVSIANFHGKLAKITIGTATKGNPAEAVLIDDVNQKHYLMVEPAYEHEIFPQGTDVVVVEKLKSSWLAIPFN
ncbi:putative inner membrane protein [Moritella sp. JT01]|uniref:YqiJ family protein n=1 Tax=Moritella sp. JT01 TaxID=756698 RepID=UPI000792B8E5|nr:YqiJ family protein [Moritella sp. JT01]KXO14267.1 putative inner membrane protein [Moritella sp. JT01]